MQASGSGKERRRGKGLPLKIFLISINPAYFWVPPVCNIFSKRYEKNARWNVNKTIRCLVRKRIKHQ
jgi:hypothetical protein